VYYYVYKNIMLRVSCINCKDLGYIRSLSTISPCKCRTNLRQSSIQRTVNVTPSVVTQLVSTGINGNNGNNGNNGYNGNDGLSGSTGPQGFQGATGIGTQGSTGIQGFVGATGVGTQGFQGATGVGTQGFQGATGVGTQGFIGATGLGAQGFQGATGLGIQGFIGATGVGFQGATGVGFQGATGVGTQGATGVGFQGATGVGFQGATGVGTQGATGVGIQGNVGATGANGGFIDFADFYALMPSDNQTSISPGASISFPNNGPAKLGTSITVVTSSGSTKFNLAIAGIYEITFHACVTGASQLVIVMNSIEISYTVVGNAVGGSQIVGIFLITTISNTTISINNPSAIITPLILTQNAGTTLGSPVSSHLIIKRMM
jgi:hypothetical protein